MLSRTSGCVAVVVALVATAAPAQIPGADPRLLPSIPGFTAVDAASIAKRARARRGRDAVSDVTIDELRSARCVVIQNLIIGRNITADQTVNVRRFSVTCN